MRQLTKEEIAKRNGVRVKPKAEPAPVVAPPVDTRVQEQLVKSQMEATLALTEIAADAINNPQLTQLITMLSQPKDRDSEPQLNKRLIVNRDLNGLIESIDIKIIKEV